MSEHKVLTKEDAINNNSDDRYCMSYPFVWPMLYKAMDEYAMQDSIGFFTWAIAAGYSFYDDTEDRGVVYYQPEWNAKTVTGPELYELYLQSKQQ